MSKLESRIQELEEQLQGNEALSHDFEKTKEKLIGKYQYPSFTQSCLTVLFSAYRSQLLYRARPGLVVIKFQSLLSFPPWYTIYTLCSVAADAALVHYTCISVYNINIIHTVQVQLNELLTTYCLQPCTLQKIFFVDEQSQQYRRIQYVLCIFIFLESQKKYEEAEGEIEKNQVWLTIV